MSSLPYEIEVPEKLINHFRIYIGDLAEYNRLIEGHESGDEKLTLAFQLWMHDFNGSPPITCKKYDYVKTPIPNFQIVFEGVMIKTLTMAGILHTRNFLNFNDGGVSFTVSDKGQSYLQWISMFLQKHEQDVKAVKSGINAEEAYDFIPSPEAWNYPYEDY